MFGPAGLFLGAFIGNRWLHGKRKNESVVYIKPEPGAREAVRVKLWKLGETAPWDAERASISNSSSDVINEILVILIF